MLGLSIVADRSGRARDSQLDACQWSDIRTLVGSCQRGSSDVRRWGSVAITWVDCRSCQWGSSDVRRWGSVAIVWVDCRK